jgi:glutamate racemase
MQIPPEFYELAQNYFSVLKEHKVDTLVLGCTHYPLLRQPIHSMMGPGVTLVSSAEETAREVESTLRRRGHEASGDCSPRYEFYTTDDPQRFDTLGSSVFGRPLGRLSTLAISDLETGID